MKKLIFSLLLFAILGKSNAQAITDNSTAEDCVSFINQLAQTNNGKDRKYDDVNYYIFKGSYFIHTRFSKYHDFKSYYENINWADFDTLYLSKEADGGIDIYLNFKKKHINISNLGILKEVNLIDSRADKKSDYFSITIPISEKGKIATLETAAKRLRQIVQTNGNIFSSQSSGLSPRKIKNIEGKPSFEETVKYINKFLEDNRSSDMFCNTDKYLFRDAGIYEDIDGNVYLLSKYTREEHRNGGWPQTKNEFKINLSKVETITTVYATGFAGGCLQTGLWFVEKDASATPKMHLPLWNLAYDNRGDMKQEKIYKAFEHLRKLCGAPEPVEF